MANYNLHKIRIRKSYSITEIAALFDVDRKTCGRWINDGLKIIEKGVSPILIMGADLKDFIKKNKKRKIPLQENQFFCFKCKKAAVAKTESEQVVKTGKKIGKDNHEQLKKTGACETCGTKLNRFL